jgi:beta-lactamase class A
VAITWTPDGTPLAIAILTTKGAEGAAYDSKPIAAAAKIAADALT